jgi:hypothetical protein
MRPQFWGAPAARDTAHIPKGEDPVLAKEVMQGHVTLPLPMKKVAAKRRTPVRKRSSIFVHVRNIQTPRFQAA